MLVEDAKLMMGLSYLICGIVIAGLGLSMHALRDIAINTFHTRWACERHSTTD